MASLRRLTLLLGLASTAACGTHHTGGGDDSGNSDGGTQVTAIVVSPATASVPLTASGAGGFTGAQAYTVKATYADGTSADVTATATLSAASDSGISFGAAGLATATIAGHYAITADLGGVDGTAELDASLTGSSVGSDVGSADASGLDGTPSSGTPTIAYPPAGALFPINVTPLEVHAHKSDPAQTVARVTFSSGDSLAFSFYATCQASPNPSTFTDACIVPIDGAFATQLAGVSETDDVSITVRLAAPAGAKLAETAPVAAAWAKQALSGGLYYWTTAGNTDTAFNTAIARYDFNGDAGAPTIYLSSADAPAVPSGQTQCVGCHAVSPDGTKLSFSLGGSETSFYSLYDVASVKPTATEMTDKYAGMATFSSDASRVITMSYGTLTLRGADSTLAAEGDPLFPEVTESKSHPFWGPSGQHVAFVGWTPSAADVQAGYVTGDMVQGGEIWLAPSDGTQVTGAAQLLVPRATGVTSYYPAISDDDNLVVFNQSSCSGPANTPGGWGPGPCDGYNDISAQLMVVPSAGGAPIALTNANGGAAPLTTNSWPRWSPDHGLFRGKRLYWVAFSSRRPYGLALAGSTSDTTKPQLWFAAVAVDDSGAAPTTDPSFAAVWLPGQDPSMTGPRGNHTPVWTSRAIPIE